MSFIRNFMKWTEGTEVPENYLFWSGVSALAALTEGRIWSMQGRFQIFPNLYVILLGPPHNGKTTAKKYAEYIVRQVGGVNLSAESETKESLARYMRDFCVKTTPMGNSPFVHTPISLFLTEFSNFLGVSSAHMLDFLTGVWDCAGSQHGTRTKNKGEDLLERPFVNLLACTTQEWITTYLKSDIIGGGFTRRVVFVNVPVDSDDKRVPRPEYTSEQESARDAAVIYGKTVINLKGEVHWQPDALKFYDDWYMTRPIPKDTDIRYYHKTKPTLLFKIAPLLAISEQPELTVTKVHVETALALLERTEMTLSKVFQGIGRNELNAIANKALEYLATAPETEFKDNGTVRKGRLLLEKQLRGLLWRDAPGRECDDIMSFLTSTEKIFRFQQTLPNGQVRVYVGLKE